MTPATDHVPAAPLVSSSNSGQQPTLHNSEIIEVSTKATELHAELSSGIQKSTAYTGLLISPAVGTGMSATGMSTTDTGMSANSPKVTTAPSLVHHSPSQPQVICR